jgi:exonuclease VII small subunit
VLYTRNDSKEVRLERIIANLDKAKLKLDEAFFYLDEIEELIQEDDLSADAGAKISQAAGRLTTELSALSGRVAELEEILSALDSQRAEEGSADSACREEPLD